MKLAVLGSTGGAGRRIVEEALSRGHAVKALARDPTKLALSHERLEVVQGDAKDPAAVLRLVEGCDAVVSALGMVKGATNVCSDGTQNVLAAMKQHGVRRYVVVSGAGSTLPGEKKPLKGRLLSKMMKTFMGPLVADKEREHALLAASDVEWTAFRPPVLKDEPKAGFRVDLRDAPSMTLSYRDLAEAVVSEVVEGRYVRKAPFVAK